MSTFRIMSYHINGARSASGELAPELGARIIRAQLPDLVMLQGIGSPIGETSLQELSDRVGLAMYGSEAEGDCAFLSRYPLSNIRNIPLGYGSRCVRADFDKDDERVHLFNLTLAWDPRHRLEQVRVLLSEQLLGNPSLPCAMIVCGDFGLPIWGGGQVLLSEHLKRAGVPLWRANYPGAFPLWGRDRVYFRGPIRAIEGRVINSPEARKASTHLPLLLTVEVRDNRQFLKLQKKTRITAKQPGPVCG